METIVYDEVVGVKRLRAGKAKYRVHRMAHRETSELTKL